MRTRSLVTCVKDGWGSFPVTREYAEKEVQQMNKFLGSLSKKDRKTLYGKSKASIANYVCPLCGGSEFRKFKKGDCSDGVTINPVICEEFA